ncbi:SMI1/KNR4 family protein [Aeoliella mucimassa]|uniref:SMI1 / KNR4 family protein n=1 Tax=Aeoliella mucimassa TaxID=2527972 RepID=A0A518ASV7_9BACT|nr:SMI1/KNR4 family protein [Aeoliella mucimassa]QDU57786.1 SMI1 / KNR4 family protein [Aeoliella mucimassa]
MTPLEVICAAESMDLVDVDGLAIELTWLPPLTEEEIDQFASELICPLPTEIRELLQHGRGFSGPTTTDVVDFTGHHFPFECDEIFPHGLPIASDGCGNFWVVDLAPESTTFGPIYFACHDPPVVLYQSATLAEFLAELLRGCRPPHESLVSQVHADRPFRVWQTNPEVLSWEACHESSDEVLQAFASRLDTSWQVIDLRAAPPGMGFSWGRYGPSTAVQRHGTLPVFAYQRPKSLWSSLFG